MKAILWIGERARCGGITAIARRRYSGIRCAQDLIVLGSVFVAVIEIVITRHRPMCKYSCRCQPVITLRPNSPFEIESMVEHRRGAIAGGTSRVGTVANSLIRDVAAAKLAISVKDARL